VPYKHAAEIGDLWKHLPLCEVLKIENPTRYFETNSAFAEYQLDNTSQQKYGVLLAYKEDGSKKLHKSSYFQILDTIGFNHKHHYLGSPGLAMTILHNNKVNFFFHDIEKEPLDNIIKFSYKLNIQDKVSIVCGDSIEFFLRDEYCLYPNDFIFLDPYMLFEINTSGNNFFDVFSKTCKNGVKTFLWYGYDNLNEKDAITKKLQIIANDHSILINSFNIWQNSMVEDSCSINPGVPGCGIAVANLSQASISSIKNFMYIIQDLYKHAVYLNKNASLCVSHLIL